MYTNYEDFLKDRVDPTIDLTSVNKLTEEAIMAGFSASKEECEDTHINGNVVIAAFTTAQARLELYSYLEKLGDRVIYMDTGEKVLNNFLLL